MTKPLTVGECRDYAEELTNDQMEELQLITDGASRGCELHPRITDLSSLRRWLQDGLDENAEFDHCYARADRAHARREES